MCVVATKDLRIIWADARSDNPMLANKFATRLIEDSLQGKKKITCMFSSMWITNVVAGAPNTSYVDYLCHMHSRIQALIK